jgi:hypothetical protein
MEARTTGSQLTLNWDRFWFLWPFDDGERSSAELF